MSRGRFNGKKIQKNLLSQIPPAWMDKLGLLNTDTDATVATLHIKIIKMFAQVSEFAGLCFFFSSAFPFCTFSSNSSTSSFKSRFLSACGNILERKAHGQMNIKKIHGGFGTPFDYSAGSLALKLVSPAWCRSKPWTLDL